MYFFMRAYVQHKKNIVFKYLQKTTDYTINYEFKIISKRISSFPSFTPRLVHLCYKHLLELIQ